MTVSTRVYHTKEGSMQVMLWPLHAMARLTDKNTLSQTIGLVMWLPLYKKGLILKKYNLNESY